MNSKISLALLWVVSLSALLACQFATNVMYPPTPRPTHTPRPPTSTATETSTPQPTPNRTATAQAAATNDANVALLTAMPDLKMLGYDASDGQMVWFGFDEMKLISQGGGYYNPLDEDLVVRDFVLGVDVQWDSESGYAGCGIIFHADDDFQRGQQGRFNTLRLSGFPAWDIELVKYGYYFGTLSGTVRTSGAINQGKDSTNHYVMVSKGSTVVVYANGTRLGSATLTERLYQGQFAFFSFTDRGIVSCNFHDGWVFELPHN